MKKLLWIPLLSVALLSMAACGGDGGEPFAPGQSGAPERPDEEDGAGPDAPAPGDSGRYLVLYATRTGNTERVARRIQAALGCDMLEVEPQEPYDNDYNAMLERAREELEAVRQGRYPAVRTSMESFDDYDIVFVGYPIWYGSMATPMQAFLHGHAPKLAGRRIALFATSGGSGISVSAGEARSLCPAATVIDRALLLTSSDLPKMESRVTEWLDAVGAGRKEAETSGVSSISITVGDRAVTATMEDNAAARDFLSRLPLEVTLSDYNHITEKIFYPSPVLTTEGVAGGCAPAPGDMAVYVPWGNVAIFCKSWSYSDDLIKIGHVDDDGIEALSVAGDVRVRFERK